MKKIKKIIVPAKAEYVREEEIILCDICGKDRGSTCCRSSKCMICKRDVCRDCGKPDPEEMGDYPDTYCIICLDLRYKKYGKEIDNIEEEAYNKKEVIINKIREESLNEKT